MFVTIIDGRPVSVSNDLETAQGKSRGGKGYLMMLFAKGRWDGTSPVTARSATAEEAAHWRKHASIFKVGDRSTYSIPDDAAQAARTAERLAQIEAHPGFDAKLQSMMAAIGGAP
jgi:hypothetical protein